MVPNSHSLQPRICRAAGGSYQDGQLGECCPFIGERCVYDLLSGAHAWPISSNCNFEPSCKTCLIAGGTFGSCDFVFIPLLVYEKAKTNSLAASNRDDVLYKFLLTHGADPRLTDEHHRTAVNLTPRLSFLSTSPSLSLLLLRCKRRQQHPALGHPAPRFRPHPPPYPLPPLSRQPHQRAGI